MMSGSESPGVVLVINRKAPIKMKMSFECNIGQRKHKGQRDN